MKCPNCGTELQSEVYRKIRPGHHEPQICYYCPYCGAKMDSERKDGSDEEEMQR